MMSKSRRSLIILLVLQVIAIILYPPSFFQTAPQAQVLPPALLLLMLLALVALNTGALIPLLGRSSLVFIQGVNIVVRLMMFFPNLRTAEGNWDLPLLIAQLLGMGISWYTISEIEKRRLRTLRLFGQES